MSQDQSEYGSFSLKKTNYTKLMRELRGSLNDYYNYSHELAVAIYEILKENKVKKNSSSASEYLYEISLSRHSKVNKLKNSDIFKPTSESIHNALEEMFRNQNNTILKPRRSAYPKLTNKQKSFSIDFEDLEATISASESSNTLSWQVGENNHNCDHADDFFMKNLFFKILATHKWGKSEGGSVTRQDESMSDDPEDPKYNISCYCYLGGIGQVKKKRHINSYY